MPFNIQFGVRRAQTDETPDVDTRALLGQPQDGNTPNLTQWSICHVKDIQSVFLCVESVCPWCHKRLVVSEGLLDEGGSFISCGSNLNMSDPNIDNICKWTASRSSLLHAHRMRHSLCDPFFKPKNIHSAFRVKESRIRRQKCFFALREK